MYLPPLLPELTILGQVLFIDLVLAGDNAVVVGMAVAGLPPAQKRRAIAWGIAAATVIRIALATVTLHLLDVVGLTLAGGLLLLWVCWRMYRELQPGGEEARVRPAKTLRQALMAIILADLSMSLDNVLAVAGAAVGHPWILAAGLVISVVMTGVAAHYIATLLDRHRWIAWAGLAIVLYVTVRLIWQGWGQVAARLGG